MSAIRVMDLFSGIGGFSLGLKEAGGFKTVCYCEIDPFCRKILQERMSDGSLDIAPICTDITRLDGLPWRGKVDLICGGFPCQDISSAGNRVGIEGEKSGLWREMARLIHEVRPQLVFVENVANLLRLGIDRVLGDLAYLGYDAEWRVLPACIIGAPHCRERVWIVANANSERRKASEAKAILSTERLSTRKPFPANGNKTWEEAISRLSGSNDGVPEWVDQTRAIGNSVVPKLIQEIGVTLQCQMR